MLLTSVMQSHKIGRHWRRPGAEAYVAAMYKASSGELNVEAIIEPDDGSLSAFLYKVLTVRLVQHTRDSDPSSER